MVVTQPQRLAGVEAMKAATMFTELDVPVLGVVENMSGAFGRGGGRAVAESLRVPLLGAVDFDEQMVTEGDAGTPAVVARPLSAAATSYMGIARRVAAALGWAYVDDAAAHAIGAAPEPVA